MKHVNNENNSLLKISEDISHTIGTDVLGKTFICVPASVLLRQIISGALTIFSVSFF